MLTICLRNNNNRVSRKYYKPSKWPESWKGQNLHTLKNPIATKSILAAAVVSKDNLTAAECLKVGQLLVALSIFQCSIWVLGNGFS